MVVVPILHKELDENVQPVTEDAFHLAPMFENSDRLQVAVDELTDAVARDERHHHNQL